MNLGKALEALKFDSRMKDWNLTQGTVTSEELESFNKGLEDLSSRTLPVDLEGERKSNSSSESHH